MQGFDLKENILVWVPCFANGASWFWGRFCSVQGMGEINMWLAAWLLKNWKAVGPDVWKIVVKTNYSKQSVCR